MVQLPDPKKLFAKMVDETLAKVYRSHSGKPEAEVREALAREFKRQGVKGVNAQDDQLAEPAAAIAAGNRPKANIRWRS
jgi:hypothetical protein